MPHFFPVLAALITAVFAADPVPFLDTLPAARVTTGGGELVFELPPTDLPAGLSHGEGMGEHHGHGERHGPGWPDVSLVTLPLTGAIHAFRVELVDSAGAPLPPVLLHHLNLIDPFHRELFLPISRRVIAAGKETGGHRLPWLLFGLPFKKGDQLVLNAMLHNPTDTAYRGVRTRLIVEYSGNPRPWPFHQAFPWQLDVSFPVGDKSFDLPPGRTTESYEAKPAVAGRIVGMGGHVHERALRLTLTDVTANKKMWEGIPITDSAGNLIGMPVGRFYSWNRVGLPLDTSHLYRVTVEYDNTTGQVVSQGGMGVIGGIMVPLDARRWPKADVRDSLYLTDLKHYLRLDPGTPTPSASQEHRH